MAKTSFSQWDTTANNNTDVGGVNIAEGCAPSGINNGMREMMAQLKAGVDGELVYATKSANYTAVAADNNSFIRFSAAATLSLTAVATLGANWHMWVAAQGGAVIIDPDGSETIDGATTLTIPNGYTALIVSSGAAFFTDKMAATLVTALAAKADSLNPFTDLASATTTTIAGVASESVNITGTTTITSLGTATAGTVRLVKFAAALTLTNNANINLPTGANITTAANDVMFAISEGTTVWRVLWYRGAMVTANWTTGTKTTPGMPTPAQIAAAISALAPSDIKAWATFDGTGTPNIIAGRNVTSITDNSTGDYTLNFTSALPNANYGVVGTTVAQGATDPRQILAVAGTLAGGPTLKTTTQCRVITGLPSAATVQDPAFATVTFIGT